MRTFIRSLRSLCFAVFALGSLTLLSSGCGGSGPANSDDRTQGRYSIVATTGMVADIVRQVAGDRAEVTALMGEGVDPHLYRPTRSDIIRLHDADVVFYSGLMLEGQMEETFEKLTASGEPVYSVTADIPPDQLISSPDYVGHPDPHVWMDVSLWSQAVETVAKRLAEYDSAHAEEYRSNAAAYRQQLEALDEYARTAIASIPEPQRYLVTAHDAFSYFSRAYEIPVESVQGITTESAPGVEDTNRLVDLLVKNKLPAIFVESSVNAANLEAVISGARSRNWEVSKGGTLYSDAMGRRGTYEGTYIGMIDHNVTTITRALGGEAPERGLNGQLGGSPTGAISAK